MVQRAGVPAPCHEIGRPACSWLFLRKAALKKRGGRAGFFGCEIRPRVEHEQVVAGAAGRFMEKRQRAAGCGRRAGHCPSGHWVAGVVHWDGGLMSASAASPAGVNKKPPPVGTGGGESGKTSLPSQCARNSDDNGDHGRRSEESSRKCRASEVHERKQED
jgi:hypothetical protein